MRYAIISDIHGNLEALNIVLAHLNREERQVDGFICCGDIIGYGARPNECTETVRNLKNCYIVAGNHDWGAVGLEDTSFFNPIALAAIRWTERNLTQDNRNYLERLTSEIEKENFMLVHGSPRDPINEYVFEEGTFIANLSGIKKNICFVGHTHVPLCFYAEPSGEIGVLPLENGTTLKIDSSYKYLINCGSIGQPRDGDPRASFGIYDEKAATLKVIRIEYDITKTQKEILDAGLPLPLALRLSYGR